MIRIDIREFKALLKTIIRIDNSALKVHLKTRDGKRTSTYQDFLG
jgi:uncharacterized protein YceH (UPF0502 family)